METRFVVDRIENGCEFGHREIRQDENSPWEEEPKSRWMRNAEPLWFTRSPHEMMRAIGIETTKERATEFSQASDTDLAAWYYLAAASTGSDEALKWVMGALAAELNTQGRAFSELPVLLPAPYLRAFVAALEDGSLDRAFSKTVFAELLRGPFPLAREDVAATIRRFLDDPRFRAMSDGDLEPLVDHLFAANPDQVAKARANPNLAKWFVGQALKATGGKAPPQKVAAIVASKLSAG